MATHGASNMDTPSCDSSFGIVMSTRSDNETSTQSSNTRSTRSRTLCSATKNQADTISKISKDIICNISTENVNEIEIQLYNDNVFKSASDETNQNKKDDTPITWSIHERLNCSLVSQSMWLHSSGSSNFMLTSIIEACKVDQELTDIIFSEYKIALSRKRALVIQLDQSPLKDVSVIKKQCYLYDDYYLFVGSSFCSLFADCNFKDCLFKDIIVSEDYVYYDVEVRDDVLLVDYLPNRDILNSDRAISSKTLDHFTSYIVNTCQIPEFELTGTLKPFPVTSAHCPQACFLFNTINIIKLITIF